MIVVDASAILASLLGEPGAEVVDGHLANALVSAVNVAEVLSRMVGRGGRVDVIRDTLLNAGVKVEPVEHVSRRLRRLSSLRRGAPACRSATGCAWRSRCAKACRC